MGLEGCFVVSCVSGRRIPSLCCVSDPGLNAIPAPNMAPSAVSQERHSCDALNRWVRTAVTCPFFCFLDGWDNTWSCLGNQKPTGGASCEGAGLRPGPLKQTTAPHAARLPAGPINTVPAGSSRDCFPAAV